MLSPQNNARFLTRSTAHFRSSPVTRPSSLPLLMFQEAAGRVRVARIQRFAFAVNVLDHTVFVNDKRGAMRHGKLVVQDSVLRRHIAGEIAQQRESYTYLFGIRFVRKLTVNANSEYLGSRLLEFGDISLIRLEFLRSTTGESEDIKSQDDILLSQELAERNFVAALIGKREVRRLVANLQRPGLRRQRTRQRQQRRSRHHTNLGLHGEAS